ncbi:hypothetical protein [Virgibacillus pantothenticus]|uniref:hypothetical protein n=1 Tax=Virgibacillus pantothenticus TaxID=1473 RepID=UPI002014C232|nr:hypothetical protein [Virgibacillus pantothenticus]
MKTLLSGISALMLIGLIIATVIYQQTFSNASIADLDEAEKGNTKEESDLPEDVNPTDSLVTNQTVDYAIENEQLFVTYDKGTDWIHVPIEKSLLFAGDYNGREDELILQSYILSEERTVFLHPKGENAVAITYSLNKGKSWQTSVIVEN